MAQIVYHGTISVFEDSLLKGIKLDCSVQTTDFGKGFYTTTIRSQAERFAQKKALLYNERYPDAPKAEPSVLVYKLDTTKLFECDGIIFDLPDERWCEFIFNNRVGSKFAVSDFHNISLNYDFVYGAVADANIVQLTRKVMRESADFQTFCQNITPLNRGNSDQLSFHTRKSLESIEFIKISRKEDALCPI